MVIHSLPLESSPPLRCWSWSYTAFLWKDLLLFGIEALLSILGKLWCLGLILSLIHISSPPPSGKGRDRGHGHTQPSFGELSSSFWNGREWWSWSYRAFFQRLSSAGKGKGWWSWSYSFLFWERGVVVIVIQSIFLKSFPLLGNSGDGGHGHTRPSAFSFIQQRRYTLKLMFALCCMKNIVESVS